jgi:hypothetical protein
MNFDQDELYGAAVGDLPRAAQVYDSGYGLPELPRHMYGHVEISVDGEIVEQVIAYDVDAGWAEGIAQDADGKAILNAAGDEFELRRLTGTVAVNFVN